MKSVLSVSIMLLFGYIAMGQDKKTDVKVEPVQRDVVLDTSLHMATTQLQIPLEDEHSVVRLYKIDNMRVRQALAFRTQRSEPKMV